MFYEYFPTPSSLVVVRAIRRQVYKKSQFISKTYVLVKLCFRSRPNRTKPEQSRPNRTKKIAGVKRAERYDWQKNEIEN